jgi:hypothetical protein
MHVATAKEEMNSVDELNAPLSSSQGTHGRDADDDRNALATTSTVTTRILLRRWPVPPTAAGPWRDACRGAPHVVKFFDLCDAADETHASKSSDYGCPVWHRSAGQHPQRCQRLSASRAWKGAMVRLCGQGHEAGHVQRHGPVWATKAWTTTCLDLASLSLLALLLYRKSRVPCASR